jgi:hypothetical protein
MQLTVLKDIKGLVIYDGPSMFDGERIIAIATGFQRSRNVKTGKGVIQIWIMRKDQLPLDAHVEGDDKSVCGDCIHRHLRSCYVNLGQGPYQVYLHWQAGSYTRATARHLDMFKGKTVRLGSYGDPAAIPVSIWRSICSVADSHLGYTHAWKQTQFEGVKDFCMASCDSEDEARLAMDKGWRPFYVRSDEDELPQGMFECPASAAAGHRLTCSQCNVCKGGEHRDGQAVPSIVAHGPSWKKLFYKRGMKAKRQKKAYMALNW